MKSTNEPIIRKALRRVDRVTIDTGEGLTEQAHKNETDMNQILRDYRKTGLIRHANKHEGKYDDVSVQDFQSAMLIVSNAQAMFATLPADMRKRFGNSPAAFLEFVQNPENKDEMRKLGILKGNDGVDVTGAQVNVPKPDTPPSPKSPPVDPQPDPVSG